MKRLVTVILLLAGCSHPPDTMTKGPLDQIKLATGQEIYRFTYDAAFFPTHIITINISSQKTGKIVTTSTQRLTINGVETYKRQYTNTISEKDLVNFHSIIDEGYIWTAPRNIGKITDVDTGEEVVLTMMDGSIWTFEGYKNGIYRIIQRKAPSAEPLGLSIDPDMAQAYKMGLEFVKLSGVTIPGIEF